MIDISLKIFTPWSSYQFTVSGSLRYRFPEITVFPEYLESSDNLGLLERNLTQTVFGYHFPSSECKILECKILEAYTLYPILKMKAFLLNK